MKTYTTDTATPGERHYMPFAILDPEATPHQLLRGFARTEADARLFSLAPAMAHLLARIHDTTHRDDLNDDLYSELCDLAEIITPSKAASAERRKQNQDFAAFLDDLLKPYSKED